MAWTANFRNDGYALSLMCCFFLCLEPRFGELAAASIRWDVGLLILAFAEGNGDWHLGLRASFQHMLEEKREGKEEGRKEDNEE